MEDKSFELLTKMYSEVVEVKTGINKLNVKVNSIDAKVNSIDDRLIKLETKTENDIDRKLDLSLEGYKQVYEDISEVKDDIKDIKITLNKHEINILTLNQK